MSRKRRNVVVVVEPLSEDGKRKFKKKVDEVYCDIVREKLCQSNLNVEEQKHTLDALCHTFEI